ncbi:hypothetical protein F6Y24_14755 [Xanthomonas arboricola pv. pruni]|nr:hypothetical protein F6Y24_14755 [Xanthomonas arboricola pv. pruni]RST68806.1 hypothetical protein EJK96_13190 [Xanthomonas arboricola pv. pruni]RST81319.1 hypothetical protein EJL05_03840 [Xanthomonas arboricola pv. pruni]
MPGNAGVAAFSPTAPCGGQLHGSMPAPVLPRRQERSRLVTSRLATARVPTRRKTHQVADGDPWRAVVRWMPMAHKLGTAAHGVVHVGFNAGCARVAGSAVILWVAPRMANKREGPPASPRLRQTRHASNGWHGSGATTCSELTPTSTLPRRQPTPP